MNVYDNRGCKIYKRVINRPFHKNESSLWHHVARRQYASKSRTWNVKIMKPGLVSEKLWCYWGLFLIVECWNFGQHTKRVLHGELLTSLTWKDILVSMLKKEKKRVADVSKPAASPPRVTRNALLNSLQDTARQVENSTPLEVRLR